jgi:hypothetical protein
MEGHYFKIFGFLSASRDEDYKASYLSYCSNFSMRSWISVLQNHVMAANYYFIITDNNCAKWASISTINSSVCFFNRLRQKIVVSVLYSYFMHQSLIRRIFNSSKITVYGL